MTKKNLSPFRRTSLHEKQLRTFLVSFLFPSFLLITLLFLFFINQNYRSHRQEQKNTLEILSSHLTTAIDSDIQMSLTYIYNNEINYFYNFLSRTQMEEDLVTYYQLLYPYTKAVSRNLTLLHENILGFGFLPCNCNTGLYFYIPKYKEIEIREAPALETFSWYHELREKNTSVLFTLPEDSSASRTISIIRAAKNVDMKLTTGYVVVDVSMDFLYDLMETLSISPGSGIVLLSPSGEFLFSTNESLTGITEFLTAAQTSLSLNGSIYDVQSFPDSSHGFTFYYLSSRRDLYADYLVAFGLVLVFYAGMVLAAVAAFRYNSRKISASVTSILDTMAKYNSGDTQAQCDSGSCQITEFCAISENLNSMIQKINLHIETEYKLQIEQKVAEYQALQAEIDPHFLHNTLNLFISLNRIGAKKELELSIGSLSHLFRYTCEHTSDTTIGKEFSFIQDYLFLQKIRFDERLEFQIHLDPELENFCIPKLLIQPLVENAIVHALEPSDMTVSIQLSAVTTRSRNGLQFTVISVTNTGLPYLADQVPPDRVGLLNIRKRLQLFNPHALFTISGGSGKPTKCYLVIPIELHAGVCESIGSPDLDLNEVNELC